MSKLKYNILDIDLTSQTFYIYELPPEIRYKYLGGAGVNAKILLDELDPNVDPLSPENILIFGAGPLVGTKFPCSGRFTVTTKSPITNIYADSNAGGFFARRMCQAGFYHIIIRGKAAEPVYIVIEKGHQISFKSASNIWGNDIIATDDALRKLHGKCETARIGPAGENQVLYANIASSRTRLSYNGRTGTGAVMGSKNLKAIVIKTEGLDEIAINNHDFKRLTEFYKDKVRNSSGCKYRATTGTLNVMTGLNISEELWEKNYQEFVPESKGQKLEPEAFLDKYYTGRKTACWNCSSACSLHWKVKEGEYAGLKGDKVEFGHTFPLGVNLGCFEFDEVLYLSDLSNKLGMDSMELGFSLGFLTECLQRGVIKEEEVGMKVEWGNANVYGELTKAIAYRKGIGDTLALGVKQASEIFGKESQKFAFHYKGQAYRMEKNHSWSLSFVVSPRGGDHLKAMPFTTFAYGTPHAMDYMFGKKDDRNFYDMHSSTGKGRYTWWHENYKVIVDCMGICIFPLINLFLNGEAQIEDLLEVYNAANDSNLTLEDFWLSAERVYQNMKLFNVFRGLNRKDDHLPISRSDETNGFKTDEVNLNSDGMLDEYYLYRGYSSDGLPTYDRLKEVDIESSVIQKLEGSNLISYQNASRAFQLFNKKNE